MYGNYSVQMNCDDNTSPNKNLECPNKTCESVEFIDKKISKQSNEPSLCRSKGEYALLKLDNFPSNVDIHSNLIQLDHNKDTLLTKGSKEKEPFMYIINNTCKKKLTYKGNNRIQKNIDEELTATEMNDKATYCRPIINLYNKQFIFKTLERNARLKNLLKKMVIARQREKENDTWNNFINMLKNKHAVNDSNYQGEINDFYETTSPPNNRSRLCKELLQKFYDHNYIQNKQLGDNNDEFISRKYNLFKYGEDLICYPTSSQARLLMIGRQQQQQYRSNWGDHVSDRNLYNKNRFMVNNKYNFHVNVRKTSSAQTNLTPFKNFTNNIHKDKATDIVEELGKIYLNNKQLKNDKNINKVSLQNVGDKLATLIESINNFIEEIKLNKTSIKENDLVPSICSTKVEKSMKSKDATVSIDIEKRNQQVETNSSINMFSKPYQIPKISDDTMKKGPSKPYEIEFEEPTRDCSTELTKSFVNDQPIAPNQDIKKINTNRQNNPIFQQITIAVNTDPLSFLALLRLSTDTLKSVLSCLPILNYCPYLLSLLVGRYIQTEQHRYICSICGAGFDSPSTLSDHIFEHNVGSTRDCCICRYVLDNVQRPVSLFRCKYCGKCFTRAYCFELHQNACGKQKGQDQDESSDLLLLR